MGCVLHRSSRRKNAREKEGQKKREKRPYQNEIRCRKLRGDKEATWRTTYSTTITQRTCAIPGPYPNHHVTPTCNYPDVCSTSPLIFSTLFLSALKFSSLFFSPPSLLLFSSTVLYSLCEWTHLQLGVSVVKIISLKKWCAAAKVLENIHARNNWFIPVSIQPHTVCGTRR